MHLGFRCVFATHAYPCKNYRTLCWKSLIHFQYFESIGTAVLLTLVQTWCTPNHWSQLQITEVAKDVTNTSMIFYALQIFWLVHSICVWIRRGELPTMQTELLHCVFTACPSWDLRRCRAAENGSTAPGDDQEGKLEAMPSLSTFVWKRKWMQFHDLPIWTVQLWQGRMDVVIQLWFVVCYCFTYISVVLFLSTVWLCFYMLLLVLWICDDLWFVWSRVFAESFLVFRSWAQRGCLETLQDHRFASHKFMAQVCSPITFRSSKYESL